jgi:CheY-like chemotaxis protein/anti-sigma regulatory factor (Ser/Thr protein kinase)
LLEDDPAMPAHRRQAVSVIRRGGDHLLSLIEGTLDLARIEGGKLTLQVQPLRFRDTLQELAHLFELQAKAKGIDFVFEAPAELPEWVRGDERRVRQILINLLGNAVKFTAQGQVRLQVRHAREMARIDIIDSGPGMDEAELASVFEPFVRGSALGSASAGGTGLGLTISKMLTDLMGGELSVQSQPGVGSTFSVRLFLPELQAEQAAAVKPALQRTGYRGPRRCILVVDNEEADRQLLADLLQPLGFVIETAASGEAGLARLATLRPDAIFMDLAMPGIDGWETIRQLRAQGLSDAPLAVVSANAFDQGLDNIVGLPPADFLVKPVRLSVLLDWLGDRLQLQWTEVPSGAATAAQHSPPPDTETPLPADALLALRDLVGTGYLRGITRKLDQCGEQYPQATVMLSRLRRQATEFQFDAMTLTLTKALDELRRA